MAILKIRYYPDPVLKKVAEQVTVFDEDLKKLAESMAETMYDAPGVGLAAPQVGISRRLVVMDCSAKEDAPDLIFAVNPEIVDAQGEVCEEEGCLSVPEYCAKVTRSASVLVRYRDIDGNSVEREASELLAIAFQHEIDHLDGILFVDRLSPLKKSMFRKKYKKLMERQEEP